MSVRRGIATVCLSGTLEDKLSAAAGAGFDGVEIFEPDLIAADRSPADIRAMCADVGLGIDLYQPFRDFEGVDEKTLSANLRRAEHKFRVMRELGTDTLLVCSTLAPHAVPDRALIAEQLHTLADRAEAHGLRIAYEALAWGRHISTWQDAWDVVRAADHPALGLCLDSFHVLARDPRPEGIQDIPGEKIFFLQLADAPRLDMDLLSWSRHHRRFPGQGSFDVTGFVDQVLRAGYRGPLSLEVFNDVFRQAAPQPTAHAAMRSLLALEEGTARPARTPARLTGFSSAEITVDPRTRRDLTSTLTALGFTARARHRFRPVELWQQNDARVLVHTDVKAQQCATVTTLSLQSEDPEESAHRAGRLMGRLGPRADTGQLLDTPQEFTGPDLVTVRFEPPGDAPFDHPGLWEPAAARPHRDGPLHRLARATLTTPFDDFDESTLFYRSVVGLPEVTEEEIAAPFGMLRSRTATAPGGTVHVTLLSTVERRGGWAPRVPDPQHLTFTTPDIFTAARVARLSGAAPLPVPENYYADLEARCALAPDLLSALREHDVYYDRDEHGETYRFFTPLFGSRIFFEVVQTTGTHPGTSASHAPVRMAAHRRHERGRAVPRA
ncbi:TIM barrel protein [Streptomyces sp. NPDC038707]|uniref:sugar phosphate isomerase/epimerase and 4-hydroxyphenylpyruvate domain-containing protein n=1 Tax=unclassified Streptomyces TaxID=2593676 RepID=UPI0033E966A2